MLTNSIKKLPFIFELNYNDYIADKYKPQQKSKKYGNFHDLRSDLIPRSYAFLSKPIEMMLFQRRCLGYFKK